MEINYLSIKKKIALFIFAASFSSAAQAQLTTLTFTHTGATQTFVIPSCVGTMTILARGAGGGTGQSSSNPGLGGSIMGIMTATPGQVLYINVGGQGSLTAGGFNGGGNGGTAATDAGAGGGGASDVRLAANSYTNRIIVAAGGGGSGGNGYFGPYNPYGGNGGGGSAFTLASSGVGGQAGQSSCGTSSNGGESGGSAPNYGTGGGGGGFTSGGGGGGQPSSSTGGYGCNGLLGVGGDGGGTSYICGGATGGQNGGGGGGGGFYGGGGGMTGTGGCNGGGGGGSSYINTTIFSATSNTAGNVSGHGTVVITYALNGAGVTATTNTTTICSGQSVSLTAASVVSYTWLPVGTFAGSNSTLVVDAPTSSVVYTLQGTNSIGCISTTVIPVTVNPGVPSLSIVNTASNGGICPSKTVALTASGAITYTWLPTITNGATFAPTTTSDYTITGSNACGTSTAITSVSIHPVPNPTAVASTASLCSGLTLTLTGISDGPATAYVWAGGPIPITDGVGFSPFQTVTYTLTVTSALTCTNTATVTVTVVTTPSLTPTAQPALICIGNSSTLTATGATNYTWTSATQTVNTATFVVTPGLGTTSYTVTKANSNCVDTKVISVVTNSLPTIFAIVTPTLVCALNSASLAVGGAQTYTWTAPGPPTYTFTGASPVVNPPASGTYTVAASDGTCINTTTVYLATNPNPTITTTPSSPSICVGQSVSITANGANTYTWTSTSSTNTFYTQSISDSPVIATAYNVSGDNSFGCVSSANQVILVYPNPTITISASKTLVCNGGASTLIANGANSYTWDPNAGGVLTSSAVVHPTNTTSGPVMYTVQGMYTNTGCSSTKTVLVNVFIGTLTISGNTNTCAGGLINLTASGGVNNSYSWNTGAGNPYNFPAISTTIAAPTTWTLNANTTSASVICPASQTVALGLFYNPTITAVPQRTMICKGESVDLYGNGGVSYVWSNNMTGGTITVPAGNGTSMNYTVTGTDANGCVNTGTVQVKISGCIGLNELSILQAGLNVYPNPNTGAFMIQVDPTVMGSDLKLALVNDLGQLIRVINLTGANNYKVSVSDLAKGIYFISGQKDNVQIYEKIIVSE